MTQQDAAEKLPSVMGGYELLIAMDNYALEYAGDLPKNISDDFFEIKNWLHNQAKEFEAAYGRYLHEARSDSLGINSADDRGRNHPEEN
jgi:hypothetical protein